jgi:flagellin FlaB
LENMKIKNFVIYIRKVYRDESGITGLETAIILIAFIVVAAVFAFTIMTTGLFSTEKAKTVAQAGISEASIGLALKGQVTGSCCTGNPGPSGGNHLSGVTFKVALAGGNEPINITPSSLAFRFTHPDGGGHVHSAVGGQPMTGGIMMAVTLITITGTDDNILESGEVVEFKIVLSTQHDNGLHDGEGRTFRVEIIPPTGGSLSFERRTPTTMSKFMVFE